MREETLIILKQRKDCEGSSSSFTSDSSCELDVLWHDCYSLGVDSAKIGVFKQSNQVGFSSFL